MFYKGVFLSSNPSLDKFPFVSIIIPARNEEKNLKKLLPSIFRSDYPNFEVIVVNDNSIDNTEAVARSFPCKVINITERPSDFLGKPYACLKGFEASKGDILIFIDADVELSTNAITSIVESVIKSNGVVSVWPKHEIKEFYEHFSFIFAIISAMASKSFTAVPSKPIGIYGPLIAVSKENYIKVGTHEVVKASVVEDFELGRRFALSSVLIKNYLGGDLVRFRMYPDGIVSLIKGWSKNSALGSLTVDLSVVIPIALFLLGSIIPLIMFKVSPAFVYLYLVYVLLFYIMGKRVGEFSLFDALLYPVFIFFTAFVIFYSFYITFIKGVVEWKDVKIFTRR